MFCKEREGEVGVSEAQTGCCSHLAPAGGAVAT